MSQCVRRIDPSDHLVFSRLKRIPTIIGKIGRQSHYPLWEMQDIGGIRAVVQSPDEVRAVVDSLLAEPPVGMRLVGKPQDRMTNPKPSGYRGVHLIYELQTGPDEDEKLNGLKVEVQVRTHAQHIWGTANEVVGTFRREDLKSGKGNADWLRFFELAGAFLAVREGLPVGRHVPPDANARAAEFVAVRDKLRVFDTMSSYDVAQNIIVSPELSTARFALLEFSLSAFTVNIRGYNDTEFATALADYSVAEAANRDDPDANIVLVSVDRAVDLRKAYPNYFADTKEFQLAVYTKAEVDAIIAATPQETGLF